MSNWEENPGKTKNFLELYISLLAWGRVGLPWNEEQNVDGQRNVCIPSPPRCVCVCVCGLGVGNGVLKVL